MTPLMQQGFKRPITDKDIWKLDSWDETETLYSQYVLSSTPPHPPPPLSLFLVKMSNT